MDAQSLCEAADFLSYEDQLEFNCWGFTAAVLGLVEGTYWIPEAEMESLLAKWTKPVKGEIEVGDIVVYRSSYHGTLIHTCVWIGLPEAEVLNKDSSFPITKTTLKNVSDFYIPSFEVEEVEFRRIKEALDE